MSRAFLESTTSVTSSKGQPAIELIVRAESHSALRVAVEHGADTIRLACRTRSSVGAATRHGLHRAGMKKVVQLARRHGCAVGLDLDAPDLEQSAVGALLHSLDYGIDSVCVTSPALALYLRMNHPAIRVSLQVSDAALDKRALTLLRLRLGIERIVLPRVVSLVQLRQAAQVHGLHLELFGYGAGCALVAGRRESAGASVVAAAHTATEGLLGRCSTGLVASNDSGFGISHEDDGMVRRAMPSSCGTAFVA
ncbi:MAG TPA: U32 family peptidase [Noviherbaspirillum sp.]|nr:U32 family peptidase [Noviherbaspirillum sp.]